MLYIHKTRPEMAMLILQQVWYEMRITNINKKKQ